MTVGAQHARIAARVRTEAHRFDVPALLDALALLGYQPSEICFRSRPTLARQGSVVEKVDLAGPPQQATIYVSVGLQSSQSVLPTYLWELQQDQRDDILSEFLWFFERPLLAQRFAAEFPERSREVFEEWEQTRHRMLLLLRLDSPTGVHWVLSSLFPELDIVARRVIGTRRVRTKETALGTCELGDGHTMGGTTDLPAGGIEVLLVVREEDDRDAAGWIVEAQQRLGQYVLPILARQNPYLFLHVQLVLREQTEHVTLKCDRYVGVHRLRNEGNAPRSHEHLLLFRGEVRSGLAGDTLNFALLSAQRGTPSRKE